MAKATITRVSNRKILPHLKTLPAQRAIAASIKQSQIEGLMYRMAIESRVLKPLYANTKALLEAHYAALRFLAGEEPGSFDLETYRGYIEEGSIQRVLEIGPETSPIVDTLHILVKTELEITYIGQYLGQGLRRGIDRGNLYPITARTINGLFPDDLPEGEHFDLIVANGVFSAGGQEEMHYEATDDVLNMARI